MVVKQDNPTFLLQTNNRHAFNAEAWRLFVWFVSAKRLSVISSS